MLQVLAGPGKAYLGQMDRLKYLLAPVVCRNAAEQERFYEVVDRFLVESGEVSVERGVVKVTGMRKFFFRAAGVVGLFGVGVFMVWFLGREKKLPPVLQMEHPFEIAVGDTLLLRNTTKNLDTQRYRTYWELYGYDPVGRETLLTADSAGGDWAVPVDTIGEIPALWVHLKAIPLKKDDTLAIDRRIRVNCTDMPPEVRINAPGRAEQEQELRFSFSGTIDPELRYRWIFEGKDTLEAPTAQRAFPEAGSQTVALLIDRPGAAGYCQREVYHQIQIGPEKVSLEPLPLLKAPQELHWTFAIGTWLLLGFLGLAVLLAWLKWMKRSKDSPAPKPKDPTTQLPRFASSDRAPYFIPFRDTNRLIALSREPQRLADVLRLRQEGLRLELDVPASVKATIEGGGFPALRERYNTQPTEYLFLVDEQSPASHQARLFRYLAALLRERDVQMEVFFYKDEPGRVWNAAFPDGLALEQVQRMYPAHRLALIGGGHGLLDPYAVGQHQVRPALAAALRAWKQRILLTPAPPRAWGYQEAALQGLFIVFPADLQGMAQAATYLEAGLEVSDLPLTFMAWKEQLEAPRRDPDPQFRRWRTATEHREYLKDRSDLFRWLCATAVFPKPTWELTIAIGEALGQRVTYDNLLILSRIPWLQGGDLPPRLREELLSHVTPGDERLARQVLSAELAAVAETASRGAANQELQINLAIQDFALEPENPEFQDTIRQLLDTGLLTRRHEAELDQVVRRQAGSVEGMTKKMGELEDTNPNTFEVIKAFEEQLLLMTEKIKRLQEMSVLELDAFIKLKYENEIAQAEEELRVVEKELRRAYNALWHFGIREYLEDGAFKAQQSKAKPPPVWTRDFKWVLGLFVFLLLPFIALWTMIELNTLEKWYAPTDQERNFFFVKESFSIDNAVIYNNQGVDTFYADPARGLHAAAYFEKAAGLPVADSNLLKLYYNLGVQNFDSVWLAIGYFRLAMPLLDGLHGLGLAYFYQGSRDSAQFYYERLVVQTDSIFFDTTSIFPNLETLLFPNRPSEIKEIRIKESPSGGLNVYVRYFNNERLHPQLSLEAVALTSDEKVLRRGTHAVEILRSGGIREVMLVLPPLFTNDQSPITTYSLRLRMRSGGGIIIYEKVVRYEFIWNKMIESPESKETKEIQQPQVEDSTKLVIEETTIQESSPRIRAQQKNTAQVLVFDEGTKNSLLGATVQLLENGIPIASVIHEDNNEFSFPLDYTKYYQILVSRPGYQPQEKDILFDSNNPEYAYVQNVYLKSYEMDLYTLIYDRKSEEPLKGVTVQLFDPVRQIAIKTNQEDNKFEFPIDRRKNYTLVVGKPGYHPDTILIIPSKQRPSDYTIVQKVYLLKKLVNDFVPLYLYFDNDEPDPDVTRTTTEKTYEQTYLSYYKRKQIYIYEYTNVLTGNDLFLAEQLIEAFFEREVREGYQSFMIFSEELLYYLEKGSVVEVTITGFASPRVGSRYNLALASRRISSVRNSLTSFKGGALVKYIRNGQLKILEVSKGANEVPGEVVKQLSSERESIYSPLASRQRRVEIIGITLNQSN